MKIPEKYRCKFHKWGVIEKSPFRIAIVTRFHSRTFVLSTYMSDKKFSETKSKLCPRFVETNENNAKYVSRENEWQ